MVNSCREKGKEKRGKKGRRERREAEREGRRQEGRVAKTPPKVNRKPNSLEM